MSVSMSSIACWNLLSAPFTFASAKLSVSYWPSLEMVSFHHNHDAYITNRYVKQESATKTYFDGKIGGGSGCL